jgi:hypothetical protein
MGMYDNWDEMDLEIKESEVRSEESYVVYEVIKDWGWKWSEDTVRKWVQAKKLSMKIAEDLRWGKAEINYDTKEIVYKARKK